VALAKEKTMRFASIAKWSFLAGFALLILVFQNCSKVTFNSEQFSAVSKGESDAGKDVAVNPDGFDKEDEDDQEFPDEYMDRDKSDNVDVRERPPSHAESESLCSQYETYLDQAMVLEDGAIIRRHRGVLLAKVRTVEKISKVRGDVVLFPLDAQPASVKLITKVRGRILLCGVSVGKLVKKKGLTVAVDATLGEVDKHHGNISLYNSSITGEVGLLHGQITSE
jgi:hypothetical protein